MLHDTLKCCGDNNIELAFEKCLFKKRRVPFIGHVLTPEGILPALDKLEAVKKFRHPNSKEEIRSFIGLVVFVSKFIEDLATKTEPLRMIVRSEQPFKWEKEQEEAFQLIKAAMCNVDTLAYYDSGKATRVVADASPVGLGAVLLQLHESTWRVVTYVAKSLTDTERRYS